MHVLRGLPHGDARSEGARGPAREPRDARRVRLLTRPADARAREPVEGDRCVHASRLNSVHLRVQVLLYFNVMGFPVRYNVNTLAPQSFDRKS